MTWPFDTLLRAWRRPDPHPPIAGEPPAEPPWQTFSGQSPEMLHVSREGFLAVYGDIRQTYSRNGDVIVDPKWERANMMTARGLPGYAKPVYVHRLVEPYLREALRRAAIAAPGYRIGSLGCFSPRHMRHDKRLPLSYHSWGVAVDIDPDENGARYFKRGEEPDPWSDEWRKYWPLGLSKEFVEAFESVGFESGCRWKGFCDPMHMQLVRS